MIILIDIARQANDLLEYIRLHLGEVYGERLDDGLSYIESSRYRPDQLLVYETILDIAMSGKNPHLALNDGVTRLYQAFHSKYPEVSVLKLTLMLEEILSTDVYSKLVYEIERVYTRHHLTHGKSIQRRPHRRVTELVIET